MSLIYISYIIFPFIFCLTESAQHHRHGGLYPEPVNLAGLAKVWANATCGEEGPEQYCRLRGRQCGLCDSRSPDKRHPAVAAIDGRHDTWWQSPALSRGHAFEAVTFTLDFGQVFQVLHVRVRSGPSPRAGAWILERALEDEDFKPWVYFAPTLDECSARYNARPPFCLTTFSKVTPVDGGEVHVSLNHLFNNASNSELLRQTKARYVRFRFQKMSSQKLEKARHGSDMAKRFYYTIRDILVQGRCICHGHASSCNITAGQKAACECSHNTIGANCEECAPLYNQEKWRSGTPKEANSCHACQCHGHATSCIYDSNVAENSLSLNTKGRHIGGGVCNCTNHTTGVNCEKCEMGWYRASGVQADSPVPCLPCDCQGSGATGRCISDDSEQHQGKVAGTCECRDGFTGMKCDRCAPGYKDFPLCEPCTCDSRGMLPGTSCHSQCFCKINVEGELCEKCRPGHFFLDRDNPDGCTECYCSHVSKECKAAVGYKLKEIMDTEGWKVCDLSTKFITKPYHAIPESKTLSIADNMMLHVDNYFWMAPPVYRGNKLTSYGSTITFSLSWDVMRGDTSGKETVGPDLVIIGENGLKIGYGHTWHKSKNMSITIPLMADGWYHVVEGTKDEIRSRRNHERRDDYRGEDVTRPQLLSVLSNIKHLLIRAKFHTDQAEGSLDSCVLETGAEGANGTDLGSIEECSCPEGYAGLSCELCDFGYARITHEGSVTRHHPICTKCNCNGHARTCDTITGQCSTCEHNTTGLQCEKCIEGYYGDATKGTVSDCRKCLCPLDQPSNNFSPVCEADNLGYVCTRCPEGYTGRHCERCDAGYFGNPEEVGSKCVPCNCNGGPCDHLTGQCLQCHGNTEGGRCDRCKPFHYGSPNTTGCFPCECSEIGTNNDGSCELETGQCKCKPKFTGRTCDRCETGLGNVSAGCVPCQCDKVGAVSTICDAVSGACECQPGVTGVLCDTCLPNHFGYSSSGCVSCSCHAVGSLNSECDITTGECKCKEHTVGRTCSVCQTGYWGLSRNGCSKCECDSLGSKEKGCDQETGQCYCKPGVGGMKCDQCLPTFYNLSAEGCSACDVCELPGHVCDPDTGACVCPPFTTGSACEECLPNTWGFHPQHGCKPCDCDKFGSIDGKCDSVTGVCQCRSGYQGSKCQTCSRGFYGYPVCQRCGCEISGTKSQYCFEGLCDCDNSGQCPCKENVIGQHCDKCKDGTFGMGIDDPSGCKECFCFGRSSKCTDAGLIWSQIRIPRPRMLTVHYDMNDTSLSTNTFPVNTQEICYINLAIPGNGGMVKRNDKQLNVTNNLRIIPSEDGDVELGVDYLFDTPVYWQLPQIFLGDKVLSYGGFLRFCVETKGESTLLPPAVLLSYPLIQIQGNDKLILEHFPLLPNPTKCHQVRFQESLWKVKNNPQEKVSRETLMIALQNLQHILIRASDSVDFAEARLRDVSLDAGTPSRSGYLNPAHGLELCDCPRNYNSTSCQDPSLGFYRQKSAVVSSTIIIQLVGEATPCQCNGRSSLCDIETGHCLNCINHTGGSHCEVCAEGYYGNPAEEGCLPCPCPSPEQNFATGCHVEPGRDPICYCQNGYSGPTCNRCSPGWYGHPEAAGGRCKVCDCNSFGSLDGECNGETGHCYCKANVTGRDCSQCLFPRHVLADETGCSECDDPCVNLLLDTVDSLREKFNENTYNIVVGGSIVPSRELLSSFRNRFEELNNTWVTSRNNIYIIDEVSNSVENDLRMKLKHLQNKVKKVKKKSENSLESALEVKKTSDDIMVLLETTKNDIQDTVGRLQAYLEGDKEQISISAMLHEAKQVLARVRDIDLEATKRRANEVLRMCNNTLYDLHYIVGDGNEVEELYDRHMEIVRRLNDFERLSNETLEKKSNIEKIQEESANDAEELGATIKDIESASIDAENVLNTTKYLNEIAKVNIQEADDNLQAVISLKNALHHATRLIQKRSNILRHNNEQYYYQYVDLARQRADELMNTTEKYMGMFKKDAGVAMKASKAYQDIIDALIEAKYAVNNASAAADIAYEKAYPGVGTDSLLDQASSSREISTELNRRAQDQLERVFALPPELALYSDSLDKVADKINNASNEVNSTVRQIHELLNNSDSIKESSLETIIKCGNTEEMTQEVLNSVSDLSDKINNNLRPAVKQLEFDGEISLNTAQDILDEAQANTKKAQEMVAKMTYGLNKQTRLFSEWNDTISTSLEELKNKIKQAHHIANSITLSMTSIGDNGGSCVRTYEPDNLEPSTMTSIVLTYAISSQLRDDLLFYLPSSTTNDFVAIEMVNRKIRFVWNVGGGIGEVTHPHHIQTAGDLSKDQHWYKVEAERVTNIGHLRVRPVVVPEGSPLADSTFSTNASSPGIGRLDIGPGDRVWVGGADRRHPHLLSTQTGLVGCLHTLYLNSRPIGLWDFATQNPNSCTACVEGAEEIRDESSYSFSGDGYAVLHHDSASAYNKYQFSVSLSFKTFDANALLFIGVGNDEIRYVSLTLNDGKVVFRIGYGGDSMLEMTTIEKYNTGQWTRVEASRYFDRKKKLERGQLKVGSEVRDGAPTPPPNQEMIPDMSEANYFIGGLPPDVKLKLRIPGPFLGCMKDILIDQGDYSLLKGPYWGIQASCSKKPITVAGFHGDGFIELPSHTLKKRDNFGFVFSTSQRDALLMLSTFEGLERLSYYSVSLLRGQVDVRLNAGRGEVRLASISSEYADSRFHTVSVAKIGKKLELRVDDSLDSTTSLPEGAVTLKAPGDLGGLYFGGLPSGFNTTGRTFSNVPFIGTIKDVIFSDKVFGFDNPINFDGVTIGRFGPGGSDPEGLHSRGSFGCRKVSSYNVEPGAVKFGDNPDSYVELSFRRRAILQKNFTVELEFRTFYPNGLIFMIPGVKGKQPHYLMAQLRNGRVQIVLKGRRKIETTAQAVFNDGVWHKMILEKEDRKMMLKVDEIDPEKTKTPKKMNIGNTMYIGGLPLSGVMVPQPLLHKLEGFKGCVRRLKVNKQEEHLISDKSTPPYRVGQCFPQVERGSYFPGDAYAVYKNKFNIGSLIELELEFRTSEMNGIILSVSEPQGYPALSLELHDGKIVMSGDMGDRRPFRMEQGLSSEYAVCDNRWHRIHASYVNDELTLRVDNLDQSYWLSDNGHLTEATTNSPLYIGGVPENASSGTLETRENFKGCIRNVNINGERKDWTGMADLHHILISSCPLVR